LEIAEASRPTGEKSEKPMRAQSLDYPFQPDDRLGHYRPRTRPAVRCPNLYVLM
jgi:hypothetical protein